jgi:hypothetical protein
MPTGHEAPSQPRPEPYSTELDSRGASDRVGSPDPTPGRRAAAIVVAFVLTLGGIAGALFGRAGPDRAPTTGGGRDATIPAEPGPPPDDSSIGTSTDAASLAEPGACGSQGSARANGVAPIEDAGATITADYAFQGSLTSWVGSAPALDVRGRRSTRFAFEIVSARSYRNALSFARRSAFALTGPDGIVDAPGYAVELLFRFDRVDGYRKILDFRNGVSDTGLYNLDGCLTFFDEATASRPAIEAGRFVHVVLVRDAGGTVAGYVDGVAQLSFRDRGGLAVIDPDDTIRFFGDDAETRGRESSSGAVARIRIYDGPIGADAVAEACIELLGEVCGPSITG